jgi:hypothetical protein
MGDSGACAGAALGPPSASSLAAITALRHATAVARKKVTVAARLHSPHLLLHSSTILPLPRDSLVSSPAGKQDPGCPRPDLASPSPDLRRPWSLPSGRVAPRAIVVAGRDGSTVFASLPPTLQRLCQGRCPTLGLQIQSVRWAWHDKDPRLA